MDGTPNVLSAARPPAAPKLAGFRTGWATATCCARAHFFDRREAALAESRCGTIRLQAGDLREAGEKPQCKVCRKVLYGAA